MLSFQEAFARALVGPNKAAVQEFLDQKQAVSGELADQAAALAGALQAGIKFRDARASAGHPGGDDERQAMQAYMTVSDALPDDLQRSLVSLMRKVAEADAQVVRQFLAEQLDRKRSPAGAGDLPAAG
jgi:hypothetical protein